jgi:bifunctional UDP-N-acetylglucosamine pyrophosphorylase / glucosamine-1-phosphate N-acetyltransferase
LSKFESWRANFLAQAMTPVDAPSRPLAAIILAAGKGTRMNSDLPKVAHAVAGRPMAAWVVEAARQAGASKVVLVVGHGADIVKAIFRGDDRDLAFVLQAQQLGTGHAVDQARPVFEAPALRDADVLVLCGDGPLIRVETLRQLLETHRRTNAAATLATSRLANPAGYGRISRDAQGRFQRIVEDKDASPAELAIQEVNPSYYCFRAADLFDALRNVTNHNAKGEFYITDVFEILLRAGKRVEVVDAVPPDDVLSINNPAQLAEVDAVLSKRLRLTKEARA